MGDVIIIVVIFLAVFGICTIIAGLRFLSWLYRVWKDLDKNPLVSKYPPYWDD